MSEYLNKAVELGKEATAIGKSLVEKTKDVKAGMGGGARFFEEDEKGMEIKKLLDSNSDRQKLEGMKRLIASISKGRDVSQFFPDVVKNVVARNFEVRKLVYIYLIRYAEQEPDIALLSINTFQKDLTDSNQLIRALALRVLSNIRIDIIIPIVMLAIKKCMSDLSPYVRKTAAVAIPKIYNLDKSQKVNLTEIIETLLTEKSTLVIGSVIAAFNEVCPERFDLIHKQYRKLCYMLIDVDEWGQIAILNLLLRYARTQFLNPNEKEGQEVVSQAFYSDDEEDDAKKDKESNNYMMDADHRLLLTSCVPLLNNRNTAVVLAVATIYYYLAPKLEFSKIGKALVSFLSSHSEIQFVLLSNISMMANTRPGAFEPYLKKFYVNTSDPFYLKVLKLEIMTKIASEGNISQILKEFQVYVRSTDKMFVTETIQAIGRCAIALPNVAESCLVGLMALISSKNEAVVAESVVVIKSLLQLRADDNADMIRSLAKALRKITVPMARASIYWLIGEYCDKVPQVAPDVLRDAAKTFASNEDIVKLETLNLGAKLFVSKAERSEHIFLHILNLAKYDMNYDIRDRARLLKALCFDSENKGRTLSDNAKRILFALKQAPVFESVSAGRERFVVGTMSLVLNKPAPGYQELPDWPETQPDPSTREIEEEKWQSKDESLFVKSDKDQSKKKKMKKDRKFDNLESFLASDDDEDEGSESDRSYNDDYSDSDRSRSRSRSRSYSGSRSRSRSRSYSRSPSRSRSRSRSRSYSGSRSRSRSRSYSRSQSRSRTPSPARAPPKKEQKQQSLLDFDEEGGENAYTSLSSDLAPMALTPTTAPAKPKPAEGDLDDAAANEIIPDVKLPTIKFKPLPLLSHITGKGLNAEFFFGRKPSLYPQRMVSVQLILTNKGQKPLKNIKVGTDNLEKWTEVIGFTTVPELGVDEGIEVNLNIDFNQKLNPINFQLCHDEGKFPVKLEPAFGELITPKVVSISVFKATRAKLSGMFESSALINEADLKWETSNVIKRVFRAAHVSPIDNYGPASTLEEFNFYGITLLSNKPVLITVKAPNGGKIKVVVNCDDIVASSTILKALKASISDPLA